MKRTTLLLSLCFFICSSTLTWAQGPSGGKVILQGFYWDYYNAQYPQGWANYLTEMAPRLKSLGIDAVWVPPSYKNANPASVGYSPFDHYDLGDKFQKGNTKTPLGDKDEFLRMVAVMHANGIEVVQDIVLNHVVDAGNTDGSGGQDPYAAANYDDGSTAGFKNFRYICYETPYSGNATNYLNRKGRWPKNWQNFYPNENHGCCSNEQNSPYWGPDVAYESNSVGQSSCTNCYNPEQEENYMREQARDWFVWFKKQTGVDGYRIDAVKHFPADVMEDLLWNAQYNSLFANGGEEMIAFGEYLGSNYDLDAWANATQNRAGTMDFGLRGSLYNMVLGQGGYDLGQLPGSQQSNRLRTVPFINTHDTFRPQVDENGNYASWDTFNELGGHIDPNEPRLETAYAVSMAVDGNPMVFMEDLFVMDTPQRFDHRPYKQAELPTRDAIQNIIWCRQKLEFAQGAYLVRHTSPDNLIIERSGKAIIGVNDSWDTWQGNWIPTNFAPGTQLHDYSGANSNDIFVNQDGWVQIWTPPCNGSNVRRGYTIWGPAGISGGFDRPMEKTKQEWEMTNDLGDSHPWSLQQGGALPANSTAERLVGKIFSGNGTKIQLKCFPKDKTQDLTLILANHDGSVHLDSVSGSGNIKFTVNSPGKNWYTIKVRNTYDTNPSQTVKVRAIYKAPKYVRVADFPKDRSVEFTGLEKQEISMDLYPNPASSDLQIRLEGLGDEPALINVYTAEGRRVDIGALRLRKGEGQVYHLDISNLDSGVYLLQAKGETSSTQELFVKQ
jgi:alpha-amylase